VGQEPEADPRPRSGGLLRVLAVPFVAALAFAGGGTATCVYHAWAARKQANEGEGVTQVVRGTPSVITSIRELARLEATTYHVERVIDLRDKQAHLFGLFESEDSVLLVASADIVAGVDLSLIREGDVVADSERRSIHLTVPPPVILSAHLDNERTYVHSRATDPLAVRAHTLETRARQEAERTLREAAIEGGILERARVSTERTLRALMESAGFQRVEISFRAE
jgi:hypothetical protein